MIRIFLHIFTTADRELHIPVIKGYHLGQSKSQIWICCLSVWDKMLTRYTFQNSYRKVKNGFFIFPKTKVYSIRIWKSSLKMKWLRNFPPFFVTQVFDLLGFTLTGIYKIEKKEHNKKLWDKLCFANLIFWLLVNYQVF